MREEDMHTSFINPLPGVCDMAGLLCFWDFNADDPFVSKGRYTYELLPSINDVKILSEAPGSNRILALEEGQFLFIPRLNCPGLNIHGKKAQVTVCAWIKRDRKRVDQCEAIAGMWNETDKKRQYCLFLNISLFENGDQVCGHISGMGGASPGNEWCTDVSIGKKVVPYHEWQFVSFTYDGDYIRSYLNGVLDNNEKRNPYLYEQGIFDGGMDGSDFTVGAVHRLREMGNDFIGKIGNLAIFDRALSEKEVATMYKQTHFIK